MNTLKKKTPAPDANALESAIGGKLAVWVGAIALALGGVFLVKFSIDQGWLLPELRVLGGLVLGLGLGATAWHLRDRSNYVSQGLAAAAVIDIYACLWAAVEVYGMIDPRLGWVGMVLTTAGAVALSLRLGSLVAILGLIGAFVAPLLVGQREPQPIALFAYLLALQAGSQFVARRRRWMWVSAISLTAGALWVAAQLVIGGGDIWPGLFLLGSTALFVVPELIKPSRGKYSEIAVWVSAAIGTLLLALNLGTSEFAPQVWLFLCLLVGGVGLLGLWQTRFARLPWMTFGITLTLATLHVHLGDWAPTENLALVLGLGALFTAIGYASLWRESGRALFAMVAVAPVGFLMIGLPNFVPVMELNTWMFVLGGTGLAYWVMLIPVLVFRNRIEERHIDCLLVPAMLLTAAAWPFGLELQWCVMLWSVQLVGVIVLDHRFGLSSARWFGLVTVAALDVCLLTPLLLVVAQDIGSWPLLNWPNATYLVAIAGCLLARRFQSPEPAVRSFLSISTVLLVLGWAGMNIHHSANAGELMTWNISALEISAHVMALTLMSLWLLSRSPNMSTKQVDLELANLRGLGVGLGMVALIGGTIVLFTTGNPWVRHEVVGGTYVLNTILIGIGLPTLLMGLLSRLLGRRGYEQHRLIGWYAAGAMIVLLTLMQVRHLFHGAELWVGQVVDAEHYAYSLSIALLAMLALGLGMKRNSRQLRVIALLGMLACSIKVFAYDMRHLEGILRVLSFLGLGVSLMALGYVYNRFGPKPQPKPETLELPEFDEILTDTAPIQAS